PSLRRGQPLLTRGYGDTRNGDNYVTAYRYPVAPFGNAPDTAPMDEVGRERVFEQTISKRAANAGVSILKKSRGSRLDPFYMSSVDENDVQGFAGTPINVNSLMDEFLSPNGAAGTSFPSPGTYTVSVDSARDPFTGRSL